MPSAWSRFIWPSAADGTVEITAAQLAYLLDGIDWRRPKRTWKTEALPTIRSVG